MIIWLGSSLFIYFSGLISFRLRRKHLLLILLRLEFIILSLFLIIVYLLNLYGEEVYFRIISISIGVCEGALGLSILVSIVRTHGSDNFQSFSVLW